jgi:peptidoglycan/LPS O-acetylase OafA/YrhL
VIAGLAALAVGAALFWRFPGELYVRRGYSELFYPPTIGYLLVAVGVIVLAFAVADRRPDFAVYAPLRALGQCALFMYVVHLAVIDFILSPLFPESPLPRFLVVYLVTAAALIGVAYGVRWLKKRWPNRPYLVRFLLGG